MIRRLSVLFAITLSACTQRAVIPPPQLPLAATPASALAGPPSGTSPESPFVMRLVRRELDNGMRIVVSRGAPDGIVSVVFVGSAWSRWDTRAPEIVTRFAAGAMFRATRLEDRSVVSDLLESEGFSPEVEVLPEGLRVSDEIAAEELPRFVELLARSLRHPVYRAEDLQVALGARIERLEGHLLTVDGVLEDRLPAMMYERTDPRAGSISDRLVVLRQLDASALQRRHGELLDPSRCALVVAGDVDPVGALPILGAGFGDLEPIESMPRVPAQRIQRGGPSRFGLISPLIRAYVALHEHGPPLGHPDHAAFRVIEQLLGGMFGAHLNLVLREEHTVSYGFHASYRTSASGGEIELTTAVDPSRTRDVVDLVLSELRRVRGEGEGVRQFELDLAKTRARETLLSQLDTSAGLALIVGRRVLAGLDPEGVGEIIRRIDALDADAIEAAARRWIRPDRAPLAIVAGRSVIDSVRASVGGEWTMLAAPQRQRR